MTLLLFLLPAFLLFAFLAWTKYYQALVLLAGLLPTYLLRLSVLGLPTNFFEVAVLILVIVGLWQPVVRQEWLTSIRRLPRSLLLWISLFLLSALISTLISPELRVSMGILKGWIIAPMIFGFLTLGVRKEKILRVLILSGAVVAAVGLLQIGHFSRLQSIYDTPNSLALFLAPIFVMGVWSQGNSLFMGVRYLFHSSKKVPDPFNPPFNSCLAIIALALLGTQSVSAIAAVIITLLIGILYLSDKSARKNISILLLLFLLGSVVTLGLSGKIAYLARPFTDPTTHSSLSVRLQLWSIGAELIREHPLLGIGLGQFEPAYQRKLHERFTAASGSPLPEFVFRDPHNWILAFWLNMGLLGLISFIAIHYLVFRAAASLTPGVKNSQAPGVFSAAIVLALFTLLIFGLTDTIYWKNDLAALQWLLLAMLMNYGHGLTGSPGLVRVGSAKSEVN